jgi:hypothetical protein
MKRSTFLYGILAAIFTMAIAALAPAAAQAPFDPPGLNRAIAVQEFHTDLVLEIDGVVGTAVGVTARGQAAVVIMTDDFGVAGLPRSLDGVPVRVMVTGKIYAIGHKPKHNPGGGGPGGGGGEESPPVVNCSGDPTARSGRPSCIGVSTGNEGRCSSGTIGARVIKIDQSVYALSNNHVYALQNDASVGSDVLQPGRYDTNCDIDQNNVIGTLHDYVQLDFSGGDNTVDAAIPLTTTEELGNATPSNGYGLPRSMTVDAAIGESVQKYGRTSSLTKGTITGIYATVNVGYSSGTAKFVDQIIVQGRKPVIKAGDSGSLLVTDPGRDPVGLLFAGNGSGKLAVANSIDEVLSAFGVTIDGE